MLLERYSRSSSTVVYSSTLQHKEMLGQARSKRDSRYLKGGEEREKERKRIAQYKAPVVVMQSYIAVPG